MRLTAGTSCACDVTVVVPDDFDERLHLCGCPLLTASSCSVLQVSARSTKLDKDLCQLDAVRGRAFDLKANAAVVKSKGIVDRIVSKNLVTGTKRV